MKPLHYLQRMTYPQVGSLAARTDLALLPVGPPEAHGPHLPVGTDLIAAGELCERAARELAARGTECLIAPLLPYCLVEVSRWYEGALPGLLYLLKEEHPEHDIHAGEWETALVLLRAPELVDQTALEALSPNWETRNISERRAAGARTFPELGAPEAYCGDPRRATTATAESLYAALGRFVAEEGALLLGF